MNITFERVMFSKKGEIKFKHFVSEEQIEVGKIVKCHNPTDDKKECNFCSNDGAGCGQCKDKKVKKTINFIFKKNFNFKKIKIFFKFSISIKKKLVLRFRISNLPREM